MRAATFWKNGWVWAFMGVLLALGISLTSSRGGGAARTQIFDVVMGEADVVAADSLEKVGVPAKATVADYRRWEPDTLVVNKGDRVVLNVVNPRAALHSLVLTEFKVDTGFLEPRGGKKTVEFVADKAGVFKFVCGIPYDPKQGPRACDPDHIRQVGYLMVLDR